MKSLRKTLFWLHLCSALAAGLVILLLSATGILLAFEAQIQGWADRADRTIAAPDGDPASLETLLRSLAAERPELGVTGVTLRSDRDAAVPLALGRAGVLYVDPTRGAITGPGAAGVRRFIRSVTDLHRFLGASGEAREAGKRATGVATLLFAVILSSGIYIWWPRLASRDRFRNALWFRRRLSPKARDFNWHHVFGIWALLPLLLVVASALPMSFEWANRLVVGSGAPGGGSSPAAASRPGPPAGGARAESPKLATTRLNGLDAAMAKAIAESPGWRSLSLRLPMRDDGACTITADLAARRGRPDLRTRLVVDAAGAVVERESFADQSAGRRVRSWMRWVHTGEAGGLAGQAVAALACAAVLFLGWTGYALAWRRFRAWRARRRTGSVATPALLSTPIED